VTTQINSKFFKFDEFINSLHSLMLFQKVNYYVKYNILKVSQWIYLHKVYQLIMVYKKYVIILNVRKFIYRILNIIIFPYTNKSFIGNFLI
jgi:hypothetical protein